MMIEPEPDTDVDVAVIKQPLPPVLDDTEIIPDG